MISDQRINPPHCMMVQAYLSSTVLVSTSFAAPSGISSFSLFKLVRVLDFRLKWGCGIFSFKSTSTYKHKKSKFEAKRVKDIRLKLAPPSAEGAPKRRAWMEEKTVLPSLLFLLLLCLKVISYLPVVERVAFPPLSIQWDRRKCCCRERRFSPFSISFLDIFSGERLRFFFFLKTRRIRVVVALVRHTAQVDHVWHSGPDPNRNFGSFSPQNRLRNKIAAIGSGSRVHGCQRSR